VTPATLNVEPLLDALFVAGANGEISVSFSGEDGSEKRDVGEACEGICGDRETKD
jgi:hypothetical protein